MLKLIALIVSIVVIIGGCVAPAPYPQRTSYIPLSAMPSLPEPTSEPLQVLPLSEGFRGVKWGTSQKDTYRMILNSWTTKGCVGRYVPKGQAGIQIRSAEQISLWICIGQATVDGLANFIEDRFVGIDFGFNSGYFWIIEGAFKERYGQPTSEREDVIKNRMGTEFINKTLVWKVPNAQIKVEKYASKVTHGSLQVFHSDWFAHQSKKWKGYVSEAAKDL